MRRPPCVIYYLGGQAAIILLWSLIVCPSVEDSSASTFDGTCHQHTLCPIISLFLSHSSILISLSVVCSCIGTHPHQKWKLNYLPGWEYPHSYIKIVDEKFSRLIHRTTACLQLLRNQKLSFNIHSTCLSLSFLPFSLAPGLTIARTASLRLGRRNYHLFLY